MVTTPPTTLLLGFAHSITDLALQTDYIGIYKSRHAPTLDNRRPHKPLVWPWVLIGHSMINGTGVLLVTGSLFLALLETFAHAFIDFFHCEGRYSLTVDQILHGVCKVVWAVIWVTML